MNEYCGGVLSLECSLDFRYDDTYDDTDDDDDDGSYTALLVADGLLDLDGLHHLCVALVYVL